MGEVEQSNVKVMVRCRPFNSREIALEGGVDKLKSVILMEGTTVRVLDHEKNYSEREAFEFDNCFWSILPSQNQFSPNPFCGQQEVFEATGAPAVENALKGFHNTIFAYGQTGSGKTHSMLGIDADEGIAPRLIRKLFESIEAEKAKNPSDRIQYTVELSFLEIYNERVKDLLSIAERGQGRSNKGSTEYADCRVRFHPEKGTFVEGLTRLEIATEEECLKSIKAGMEHRAVTSTQMNDTSSRSHAIFQICLSQKSPLKGTTRCSIINLVDLAGSERIKMSGVTGAALQEAKMINLSLSTLRRVIDVLIDNSKLKKGQRPAVPPYRESLLTWVLSDSLGGNSKTMFVAAVSPYSGNIEDTMGTLRYALKAKAIVCNARVNEEKTAAVVNALRAEMEELRKQLEDRADADAAEQQRLEESLKQREEEFTKMQEESKKLDEMKEQYEEELKAKSDELAKAQEQMHALENVEEEKVKKEEELIRARELQAQTAEMLRVQEEERKRKDAELAAVIQRKNSLKRHHDKAAEEEAKARLAAEQARRRQFVSAFQNAFILGRQKSGLEELRDECAALELRVEGLEVTVKEKDTELQRLMAEKSLLQRKVEMLEKKCQSMQRDLQEVLESKNEKINELTELKKQADDDLEQAKKELASRKQELDRLRDLHAKEQSTTAAKIDSLQANHDEVKQEIKRKELRLEQLQAQRKESEDQLNKVTKQVEEYSQVIEDLRKANIEREDRLLSLQQRKSALERQRDSALMSLAERQERLANTQAKLKQVSAEAEELKQNHNDLRQYVSQKFFPTAKTPPMKTKPDAGALVTPGKRHQDPNSNTPNRSVSPNSAARNGRSASSKASQRSPSPQPTGTPNGKSKGWR